jgi:peptide/nickel transport system permease protein
MANGTVSEVLAGQLVRAPARRSDSLWAEAGRRFRRHRLAMIGLIVLTTTVLAVVVGPFVYRVPVDEIDFRAKLKGPTSAHPLGTDDLGQDILARILYGGRISLAVGVVAMLIGICVGTTVGAVAGQFGGAVDSVLMRATDLFLSLPQLPIFLLVVYLFRDPVKKAFGPELGAFVLIVAVIGALRWMPVARLVRAQFLSLREKEFVEAARAQGASDRTILFREILPNLVAPIVVYTTLVIPQNILLEAALSYLGVGINPPQASWGEMIAEATPIFNTAWWFFAFPGAALLLTVLAFNLVGDGVRDALDPRTAV